MLSLIDRGEGSAIVFLHGFGLDGRMWEPQLEALRGSHRSLAVDLPGFGPKPAPASPGLTTARTVLDMLDEMNIERVHVVGHSLGGAIAADFALAFPHRVRTLVLVAAPMRGSNAGIVAWDRCVALARENRMNEAREAWLGDPLFASANADPATSSLLRAMVTDYGGAHWRDEISTTFESAAPPTLARLAELRLATLVIAGDKDLPTFLAMADAYASTLPRAKKIIIPGAGHMPNLEAPAAFNEALATFFSA